MTLFEYAKNILLGESLEEKLTPSSVIEWNESELWEPLRVKFPARNEKISFSQKQIKFPGKGALKLDKEKGKALHFFANHELLAIEMFAQAILLFPELKISQRKLLVKTLEEEQKHFSLYLKRMNSFGVKFGDFPLNQFFWSFMEKIETPDQFFATISLTFEQANLDFAKYYHSIFELVGDGETANILKIVYEDEIKHVARGRHEVAHSLVGKEEAMTQLWEHYCDILPPPLTPARAKGLIFDEEGRKMAGLPTEYIESLKEYRNSFAITDRKQWQ